MSAKCLRYLIAMLLFAVQPVCWAADEEQAPVESIPGYVSLGDAMVLNLSSGNRQLSFLQLKADVLVTDDDAKEAVEAHIPAIRHQLIVLLSEQTVMDMKTPGKREQVRQQATQDIRDIMEKLANNTDIEEVLFSSFLVQ